MSALPGKCGSCNRPISDASHGFCLKCLGKNHDMSSCQRCQSLPERTQQRWHQQLSAWRSTGTYHSVREAARFLSSGQTPSSTASSKAFSPDRQKEVEDSPSATGRYKSPPPPLRVGPKVLVAETPSPDQPKGPSHPAGSSSNQDMLSAMTALLEQQRVQMESMMDKKIESLNLLQAKKGS